MQTIKEKNNSEKIIRICSGFGKSLILRFLEFCELSWLKEKIFALLKREEGIPVKGSCFTTVLKFEKPETREIFYFKEFHSRSMKDRFRNYFGVTRGKRDLRGGQLLLKHDFLAPVPVLHAVEKTFCVVRKDVLITRGVSGERTYQYFEKHFLMPLSAEMIAEKRALMYAAGHEIGKLHSKGIFHGDLRVGNIIINGKGSTAQFFFIDNERTKYYSVLPEKKRLKNLVQLNMVFLPQIKMTDRLRFLTAYVTENPMLSSNKKELIRKVQQLTQKRALQKNLQNLN